MKTLPPPSPAGASRRLVGDLRAALRVVANLSGFGRRGLFARLGGSGVERVVLRSADGEAIEVELRGAGAPIVLVHGFGGSRHDWDAVAALLARRHRTVAFDQRGHGARADPLARPTLDRLADDLAQVLAGLALERPFVVGHSLGALVVLRCIERHGARSWRGVGLVDQSPRIVSDEQWRLGVFGSLGSAELESALLRLRRDFPGTLGDALGANRRAGVAGLASRALSAALVPLSGAVEAAPLLALLESIADCDFRHVVARLKLPTLVVLGGASHHYRGLPLADWYRGALANGSVVTIVAAAHSPHRQQPERFAAELAAFVHGS